MRAAIEKSIIQCIQSAFSHFEAFQHRRDQIGIEASKNQQGNCYKREECRKRRSEAIFFDFLKFVLIWKLDIAYPHQQHKKNKRDESEDRRKNDVKCFILADDLIDLCLWTSWEIVLKSWDEGLIREAEESTELDDVEVVRICGVAESERRTAGAGRILLRCGEREERGK